MVSIKIVERINTKKEDNGLRKFTEYSVDDFIKIKKKSIPSFEYLYGDVYVKPYFDFELYKNPDEVFDIENIKNEAIVKIKSIIPNLQDKDIAIAEAHRMVTKKNKKEFKISFRMVINGIKIKYDTLDNFIKNAGLQEGFDTGVYTKKEQLIGCIDCIKNDEYITYINKIAVKNEADHRFFKAITSHTQDEFIIQNLLGTETEFIPIENEKVKPLKKIVKKIVKKVDEKIDENLEKYVNLLSIKRASDYDTWVSVGLCLKTLSVDNEELFLQFSKKSPTYDEVACKNKFNEIVPRGDMKIGTLKYWAKEDNPDEYEIINDNDNDIDIDKALLQSISGTHNKIAKVAYILFGTIYTYSYTTTGSVWYYFKNHRWKVDPDAIYLKQNISSTLWKFYMNQVRVLNKKATETNDEVEKIQYTELSKKLFIIAEKLLNVDFKSKLVKELIEFYAKDISFIEQLDEKKNLIGFNNGIIDLEKLEIIDGIETFEFRDGTPEDMVTFSTGYDYNPNKTNIQDLIMKFIRSIMQNEEMVTYLMTSGASCLSGNKFIEQLFFLIGAGGNGKGLWAALIMKTFGEYGYAPNVEMFTCKKTSSSSASCDWAKAKGKRILIATEPSEDDKFQLGTLKKISGRDTICARDLFKPLIEFVNQFSLFIQMNNPPDLNGYDAGIGRRLRSIPFSYKFCENPTRPNEKLIDPHLKTYFTDNIEVRQQFMLILLDYYKKYIFNKSTVHIPEIVQEFTQEYLDSNNPILDFINKKLEITDDKKDVITPDQLISAYKDYDSNSKKDKKWLGLQMGINGLKSVRCNTGINRNKVIYIGIKINPPECKIKDQVDDLEY
jgi:P4 family phage/plasmid primase-like protien